MSGESSDLSDFLALCQDAVLYMKVGFSKTDPKLSDVEAHQSAITRLDDTLALVLGLVPLFQVQSCNQEARLPCLVQEIISTHRREVSAIFDVYQRHIVSLVFQDKCNLKHETADMLAWSVVYRRAKTLRFFNQRAGETLTILQHSNPMKLRDL